MKRLSFKTLSVAMAALITGVLFTFPQKAHAQWAVADAGAEINTSLTTAETSVSAVANSGLSLKSFTLDKIATSIAKQILQQLTLSVISWINSGFHGSPSFVQNPGKFFENVGDQIAGSFLAANSPLAASLCSPFSIDVRISLALQMSGGIKNQNTCTLSSMIKNTKNAIKGASINGFTAGDFRQGGWPAFLALTTVPANNPNGAFLQAQEDLNVKIGNQVVLKQNLLIQGSGFLSFETCKPDPSDDGSSEYSDDSGEICEVQTPGSAISGALNKSLGVPTDELELANDINAIINAAFSQLILIALRSGLGAISGSGNTNSTAYAQQVQAEQAAQVKSIQSNAISSINPYLGNAAQIAVNAQTGLNTILAAQNTLNQAQTCYNNILISTSTRIMTSQANNYVNNQLGQINTILTTQVAPLVAKETTAYASASTTVKSLYALENSLSAATSSSGLSDPSQQIQGLANSGSLPSTADVLVSTNDLTSLQSSVSPIQADANSRLNQCQVFNPATYGMGTIGN